jgi:hypothetical protein
MIIEQEILDLGLTKMDISTEEEGWYEILIDRSDLGIVCCGIYRVKWDFDNTFLVKGKVDRVGSQSIPTTTFEGRIGTIDKLEEILGRIIEHDMQKHTRKFGMDYIAD